MNIIELKKIIERIEKMFGENVIIYSNEENELGILLKQIENTDFYFENINNYEDYLKSEKEEIIPRLKKQIQKTEQEKNELNNILSSIEKEKNEIEKILSNIDK